MMYKFNTLDGPMGEYEIIDMTDSEVILRKVVTIIHRCPCCGRVERKQTIYPKQTISRVKYDAFVKETEILTKALDW